MHCQVDWHMPLTNDKKKKRKRKRKKKNYGSFISLKTNYFLLIISEIEYKLNYKWQQNTVAIKPQLSVSLGR